MDATATPPIHCLSHARARGKGAHAMDSRQYGRLFPAVPSFDTSDEFLCALGRTGGACDCVDDIDTPTSDASEAAGWPIFGQLVAHDITADRSAPQHHSKLAELRNARAPQLNLESLYGDGPGGHPFLYRRDDPAKILLGDSGGDVQRNAEGIAIIGDPRDDSHLLVSQLHLAFCKVHNAFVEQARADGSEAAMIFDEAARQTRWTCQWIVVNEFLPSLVGRDVVERILNELPHHPQFVHEPFIPLEFADAAYRYGHSQIRHRYRLNDSGASYALFPDLLGFQPVPAERRVDWTLFFDAPGRTTAQRAKKIDGRLVRSLITLPEAVSGHCESDDLRSLAVRDLMRGQGVGLPSGEALARHLGVEPLTRDEIGLNSKAWSDETPLWYYLLREADLRAGGNRLGPLGGLIVAEVLISLLRADRSTYLNADPHWRPSYSSEEPGIASLIAWAEAAHRD
jgi:hypothetical protein